MCEETSAARLLDRAMTDALGALHVSHFPFHLTGAEYRKLGESVAALAGKIDGGREALESVIAHAARSLESDGEPPSIGPASEAWRALLVAAAMLHSSGAHALGRLPIVSDSLLRRLAEEASVQRPSSGGNGRSIASAGDILAGLAVSRQVREAVSHAIGAAVVPTYDALYEYDVPGSHVRTHLDAPGWEYTLHLLIEHRRRGLAGESILIVHDAEEPSPRHLILSPGDSVVVAGRGTFHSWAPLESYETRTLIAAGFRRPGEWQACD